MTVMLTMLGVIDTPGLGVIGAPVVGVDGAGAPGGAAPRNWYWPRFSIELKSRLGICGRPAPPPEIPAAVGEICASAFAVALSLMPARSGVLYVTALAISRFGIGAFRFDHEPASWLMVLP